MFKVGDEVRCVISEHKKGTYKGSVYMVDGVHGSWMNLKGFRVPFHAICFEKVNEMTTTENKTIINEKAKPKAKANAKPVAEAYYVRHKPSNHGVALSANNNSHIQIPATLITEYADAVNEANRLAELHAGSEFVILGVVYKVKKVPVYTTQAQEYSV